MECECAGIGRQARLRGVCLWRTGSSPVTRTKNPECESVRDFTFYLLPIHYYLNRIRDFGKVISKKY